MTYPLFNTTDIFSSHVILEDDRVLLRPLEVNDVTNLLAFAESEPELWKFSAVSAAGKEGMKTYVETAIRMKTERKEYPFIVFDKHTGRYAGSTRFYDINIDFSTAQLGYTWYGQKFQRSGLNRHCKWLMLTYAFETWGLERIEFRADNRNERSIKAMKDIGCVVEGVLRSNMPLKNEEKRRDSIVLSILKDEWFSTVKNNLFNKIYQ